MSKLEAYHSAFAAHEQAKIVCSDMVGVIERASATLARWQKTTVSNIESQFPNALYGVPGNSIDAREWPTAEVLSHALQNFHTTKEALKSKYAEFTITERQVIKAPPA